MIKPKDLACTIFEHDNIEIIPRVDGTCVSDCHWTIGEIEDYRVCKYIKSNDLLYFRGINSDEEIFDALFGNRSTVEGNLSHDGMSKLLNVLP